MNLKRYNNKCVKITCVDGKIYEGICCYDSPEYCFHEFGREEEALEILHFLFYKSDILKIRSLENHHGPYGKFTEKYGEIEKDTVDDMDLLEQALEDEEDEHIYRILLCLEEKKLTDEIYKLLDNLIKYNKDEKINKEVNKLLEKRYI